MTVRFGMDCDDAMHRFHPLLPVSGTGTGFDSSAIKGEGDMGVVLLSAPPFTSGLRVKSAMTGCHALLHTVDSRLRGNDGKGLFCLVVAPHTLPLWIADQVRNDVTMRCIVFILCSQCQALGQALILSHQGEGILSVGLACCQPGPSPLDCGSSPQ